MGTTNRDASQVTVKKRNMAENAYYNDWKNVTVTPINGNADQAWMHSLLCREQWRPGS